MRLPGPRLSAAALRRRCGECSHHRLLVFSCKRRGFVSSHIGPWWEGQDVGPDSGKHHLDKAIAALMALRDLMLHGNWVDDRAPRGLSDEDMDKLNAEASAPVDRYGDRNPRHYAIQGYGDRNPRHYAIQDQL